MSSICGLPTISTLIDLLSPPLPPPPPAPAHPEASRATPAVPATSATRHLLLRTVTPTSSSAAAGGLPRRLVHSSPVAGDSPLSTRPGARGRDLWRRRRPRAARRPRRRWWG